MTAGGILVVGGDGFVARTLVPHLRAAGEEVDATTRRADRSAPDRPVLDLATGEGFACADRGYDAAILCAARARLAECRAEPEATALVNMTGTLALARRLAAAGTRVILLSTDKVFDGSVPDRPETDPTCPATAYGRQKAAAEEGVLALKGGAVLRLSKVVGRGAGPFAGWVETLRGGGAIQAFADFPVAPVPTRLVAEAALRMIRRGVDGIIQATGAHDIDYARAGRHLARRVGVGTARVEAVRGQLEQVLGGEPPSLFTALDGTRLCSVLNLERPDPFKALDSVLAEERWE